MQVFVQDRTAESISQEFHLMDLSAPEDPVLRFTKLIGGRIHYLGGKPSPSDSISLAVHGPNDFDVYLSRYTGPLRDRFTLAHELGHYFLHASQGTRPMFANRNGHGPTEDQANWFALALLMPMAAFSKAAAELDFDPIALAGRFLVPRIAAEVRLASKNMINT